MHTCHNAKVCSHGMVDSARAAFTSHVTRIHRKTALSCQEGEVQRDVQALCVVWGVDWKMVVTKQALAMAVVGADCDEIGVSASLNTATESVSCSERHSVRTCVR